MICSVYERRPRTTRTVTDPRSAKPVDKIEFEDLGRHHLNVEEIKRVALDKGYTIASTPNATPAPGVDFVLYVEPSFKKSPIEISKGRRRVVTTGTSGPFGRKMPLPRSR